MQLTKRQRNEIFETLVVRDIGPADCEIEQGYGRVVLRHLPSESSLDFADGAWGYEGAMRIGNVQGGDFWRSDWQELLEQIGVG